MPNQNNNTRPGLFGLANSNKDFSDENSWGKNQFNNTFPAGLANYMASRELSPVYIRLNRELATYHEKISVEELYGISPTSAEAYFSFETEFEPYRDLAEGWLPRVDLVVQKRSGDTFEFLKPIEIKLTALPDDQTSDSPENDFGSEIVVRPDTIVYLALGLAHSMKNQREQLKEILAPVCGRRIDWTDTSRVEALLPRLVEALNSIILQNLDKETPILIQPVWKTKGKSTVLADNCLDIFVWSNFALTRLFVNQVSDNGTITRPERSVVWLAKMLYQFATDGRINHQHIIDTYTYGTKNDKAFAIGGMKTREYMRSPELLNPRITRPEIKSIILGGGEKLLSPERRFDGIVQSTIDLFETVEEIVEEN